MINLAESFPHQAIGNILGKIGLLLLVLIVYIELY